MLRFLKRIPRDTLVKLYNILPHFYYSSIVWHFCGERNTDKVGALNKRILKFILLATFWFRYRYICKYYTQGV